MKQFKQISMIAIASAIFLSSCDKDDNNDYPTPPAPIVSTVVKSAGDKATVEVQLNEFRTLLGDPVNTTPDQPAGRREVNWEGVPPQFNHSNPFLLDFFNLTDPAGTNNRKRGLVYVDNGSPIRVDSTKFDEIDPSYANEFTPFSGKRIVISANSTVSEVIFKVPGTNIPAFVKGFGIIFIDVEDANATTLEFFNGNKSLGVFKAPVKTAAGGFSFLGVRFPEEEITRIKINAGNGVLATGVNDISNAGTKDLVAFDDFFYDEPKANN